MRINGETVGNAAAMREALEFAREMINDWNASNEPIQYCQYSDTIDKIDSALSAPPRNCDVGTAEEQKERFEEFCDDEKGDRRNCLNCRLCNALDCELAWAQMPYNAERKGEGDGR